MVTDVSSVFLLDLHRDVLLNLKESQERNEHDWTYTRRVRLRVLPRHKEPFYQEVLAPQLKLDSVFHITMEIIAVKELKCLLQRKWWPPRRSP